MRKALTRGDRVALNVSIIYPSPSPTFSGKYYEKEKLAQTPRIKLFRRH